MKSLSKISELKKIVESRKLLHEGIESRYRQSHHIWIKESKHKHFIKWLRKHRIKHYVNGSSGDGIAGIHLIG